MNTEQNQIIIGLLKVMEHAIESGDWIVDGRCDPHFNMTAALNMTAAYSYLKEQGYRRDGITGNDWLEPL